MLWIKNLEFRNGRLVDHTYDGDGHAYTLSVEVKEYKEANESESETGRPEERR